MSLFARILSILNLGTMALMGILLVASVVAYFQSDEALLNDFVWAFVWSGFLMCALKLIAIAYARMAPGHWAVRTDG